MLNKIPNWLKNKYGLTILFFFIWVTFFDQNNLFTQYDYHLKLKEMEREQQFYNDEIAKTKKELNELSTDQKALEKFAREKYLMKKDNEEIFVFEAKKED